MVNSLSCSFLSFLLLRNISAHHLELVGILYSPFQVPLCIALMCLSWWRALWWVRKHTWNSTSLQTAMVRYCAAWQSRYKMLAFPVNRTDTRRLFLNMKKSLRWLIVTRYEAYGCQVGIMFRTHWHEGDSTIGAIVSTPIHMLALLWTLLILERSLTSLRFGTRAIFLFWWQWPKYGGTRRIMCKWNVFSINRPICARSMIYGSWMLRTPSSCRYYDCTCMMDERRGYWPCFD